MSDSHSLNQYQVHSHVESNHLLAFQDNYCYWPWRPQRPHAEHLVSSGLLSWYWECHTWNSLTSPSAPASQEPLVLTACPASVIPGDCTLGLSMSLYSTNGKITRVLGKSHATLTLSKSQNLAVSQERGPYADSLLFQDDK